MSTKYAIFNTGFRYQFTFNVQNVEDVTLFGGEGEIQQGKGQWNWTSVDDMNVLDDPVIILTRLREFEEYGFILPKFYEYPHNLEGTSKMFQQEKFGVEKMQKVQKTDIQTITRFRLGCLIYHQLLYQPNLCVEII